MKAGTLTGASHRLAKVKSETKLSCCGLLNGASSPVSSCEAGKSQKTAGYCSQGNRGYLGGNQAQEFLTTSFLAFSGLKMPKTTSLEPKGGIEPRNF